MSVIAALCIRITSLEKCVKLITRKLSCPLPQAQKLRRDQPIPTQLHMSAFPLVVGYQKLRQPYIPTPRSPKPYPLVVIPLLPRKEINFGMVLA